MRLNPTRQLTTARLAETVHVAQAHLTELTPLLLE